MSNPAVDLYLVYAFISRLVTPFNKWDAYKTGVIDEKGNILISRDKMTTGKQRDSFRIFDQLVLNVKKMLAKIPGGDSRFATYAAALFLIKEQHNNLSESQVSERFSAYLNESEGAINSMGGSAAPSSSPPGNIALVDKILNKRNNRKTHSNGKQASRSDP